MRQQALANLANFAYDPANYCWLRELNVIDLFLDCMASDVPCLAEFAVGGLCNLCNGSTLVLFVVVFSAGPDLDLCPVRHFLHLLSV